MDIFYGYVKFTRVYSDWLENLAGLTMRCPEPKGLRVHKNIVYSQTSPRAVMDFFSAGTGKKPLLIYIHGGGFITGNKEQRKYYGYHFVEKGFAVLNVEYEYAPELKFPGQLCLLFKAIEKLLDMPLANEIDFGRVVLAGESAGAYFSAFIAAICKNPELYDKLGIDFKYRSSFDVAATVLVCGLYNTKNMLRSKFFNMGTYMRAYTGIKKSQSKKMDDGYFEKMSPLSHVNGSFPPSVIIRSKLDLLQRESLLLAKKLDECGVEHCDYLGRGMISIHAFPIAADTKRGRECFEETMRFLEKTLPTNNSQE